MNTYIIEFSDTGCDHTTILFLIFTQYCLATFHPLVRLFKYYVTNGLLFFLFKLYLDSRMVSH